MAFTSSSSKSRRSAFPQTDRRTDRSITFLCLSLLNKALAHTSEPQQQAEMLRRGNSIPLESHSGTEIGCQQVSKKRG